MSRPVATTRRRTRARRAAITIGSAAALIGSTLVPIGGAVADTSDVTNLGDTDSFGVDGTSDAFVAADSSPTGAWFIELKGAPTTRGGSASALADGVAAFEDAAADLNVDVEIRETYSSLWNGVAIDASDDDAATLASASNVVAVYPVLEVAAPASPPPTVPDMLTALQMTGADITQSELGYTGAGVRVGIIDTGVDYDHPDLGGSGTDDPANFPNSRVVAGYDFVGDDFNANDSAAAYQPIPRPDPDPDDCQGHGTHVAGIAAASGDPATDGVRGVAPGAEIGAYRVFGCDGSTTSDVMLAAMERALDDGMDVVNQSIGSAFASWPGYPTAVGSDNLVAAGVVMVASIGNEGDLGLYASGAPGVGKDVIGVASYDNTEVTANVVDIDGIAAGYGGSTGAPLAPTDNSTLPVTSAGEPGTPESQGCTADVLDPAVAGTAVLIQRGACSFYEKALSAQQAGAAAAILYNNTAGIVNPTVEGAVEITIPVVMISLDDGLAAVEAVADGGTLTWTDDIVRTQNPTGGLISSFSSYGLAADLSLKPDIGAPGGSIWSTVPLELGAYASNSGTSMSSPHVAGAVALYLEAHPKAKPKQVRDSLLNSADPSLFSLAPDLGLLEPVNHQGAGMLDIDDAILGTTSVSPSKLSLGESEGGPVTQKIKVRNNGDTAVTYQISTEDAVSTSENPADGDAESPVSVDTPGFVFAESTVQAPASITVKPGRTATFKVTISPNADYDLVQYGGYIYLINGDEKISIPYAGFAGDYQSLPILTPGDNGFPALGVLAECGRLIGPDCTMGGSWNFAEPGQVYSMADGDVPTILAHLNAPVQNLTIDIYKAKADGTRGAPVHPRFFNYLDTDFVGRSGGGPNVFSPYTWDGTRNQRGTERVVPDGNYILVLTVVNALGDESNPDHVESYETPSFTVDRDGDGNPQPPQLSPLERLIKLLGKLLALLLCKVIGVC